MDERTARRLHDLIERLAKAIAFVDLLDQSPPQYRAALHSAVERELEIAGEAAKHVPPAIQEAYPDVPWRRLAGLRNILARGYASVDIEMLLYFVRDLAPALIVKLEQILQKEDEG